MDEERAMPHLTEIDASGLKNLPVEADRIARLVEAEGAVTLRDVIPPDFAQELLVALKVALAKDADSYGVSHPFPGMVHALMARGKPFLKLLECTVFLAVSRAILGHGCIVHAYNSSSIPPEGPNFTSRIHVDSPRLIKGYITNIGWFFPLSVFTPDNGPMEIAPTLVPREHCPSEEEFKRARIVLDNVRPGDAVCFNVRCWHRGGINRTSQWRHAVTVNVCRAFMRQQFDYPRLLGEGTVSHLSPDLQQALGYYVRMPTSMEEFLLPAEQRLYRPGQE
jgi:Phytanoyl-CoA dioxygenase (PhyH)